ncbi:MAG: dTDP-glucose 4,6-dehydratase [Rhodospirillales bacterium]|nr:dTDP-glucose 4,6-dehydratase [Rhodospirillales bacterium]USO08401.1 MAG: dTDP-glucose 4,6-dehydratase [Rhodospirillales bacterium]
MNILITGGAGFIGSHLVRAALSCGHSVLNYDALTYAANPLTLADINTSAYRLIRADVTDAEKLTETLTAFRPDAVIHVAAETHVDRSIDAPAPFIHTNVAGTLCVLEATLAYWKQAGAPAHFRLIHVSTDEVYGPLADSAPPVREGAAYNPSSPYAASKAASDHLARAWARTWGLPVIVTQCGNNFGSCQYPEKLIPHMILRALAGETLPIYGAGDQIRDWIHAADHADALLHVLGMDPDQTVLIGAQAPMRNIDVVTAICAHLDALAPRTTGPYADLIRHVEDRPGHDRRYALDPARLYATGWRPRHEFGPALRDTVAWYINNPAWVEEAREKGYHSARIGQRAGG